MSEAISYGPLIETRCPECNYTLTGATKVHGEEAMPEKGDSSVCINCGQVLIYEADLTLRKPTAAEISDIMDCAEAWAVIEKAQMFIRKRGRFA